MAERHEYSHIENLGVDNLNNPTDCNIVGLEKTRIALSYLRDKIRDNKINGCVVVLEGEKSSGKTTAAIALFKELESKNEIVDVNAIEIKSIKKIDEILRKANTVTIKEKKNVYTGEILEIKRNSILLKSRKGSFLVEGLGIEDLRNAETELETIEVGDIIYIEGRIIRKMGKCETKFKVKDVEAVKYMPLPKQEVESQIERVHKVSLFDLDFYKSEATREEINKKVKKDVLNGFVEVKQGIVFIRNAEKLSEDYILYLKGKIEEDMSPVVILAMNEIKLNSIMNGFFRIKMDKRSDEDKKSILQIKINEFKLKLNECSFEKLFGINLDKAIKIIKVAADNNKRSFDEIFNIFV